MPTSCQRRHMLQASVAGLGFLAQGAQGAMAQTKEAIPAQPSAPAPSPKPDFSVFAATPFIDHIALSPDGSKIAMITQKGDEKILGFINTDRSNRTLIGLGKGEIKDLFFADESHLIIINSVATSLPEYASKHQISHVAIIFDMVTHKTKKLYDNMENFYGMVTGYWQRIKTPTEYRVVASNVRMDGVFNRALYSFSVKDGSAHELIDESPDTCDFVVTPTGHPLAYANYNDSNSQWELFYNTGQEGKPKIFKSILKQKYKYGYPDLLGLGRTPDKILMLVPDEDGGNYYEIGADGVVSEALYKGDKDINHEALFHPVTHCLAGFKLIKDWTVFDYFDPLMKKINDAIGSQLDESSYGYPIDFAEDPRKLIVYAEANNDAGTYFYMDFTSGRTDILQSNYGQIPEDWISKKEPIHYRASDGLDIHGFLTLPPHKEAKNLPLVVLVHDGPRERDYASFDWMAQTLAAEGYSVLQSNFRGSTGYGAAFIFAGDTEWGGKMQSDLSDGVRNLAKKGLIDPKRVAIMGTGYGGYAALAGATLEQDIYKCAIDIGGISDLNSYLDHIITINLGKDNPNVRYWQQMFGDKKNYNAISPAKQAAKANCPILIIHGRNDAYVPVEQSEHMVRALKDAQKPHDYIDYNAKAHWDAIESTRIEVMKHCLDYLTKYNPA